MQDLKDRMKIIEEKFGKHGTIEVARVIEAREILNISEEDVKEYQPPIARKIIKIGSSVTGGISLPAKWLKEAKAKIGDTILIQLPTPSTKYIIQETNESKDPLDEEYMQ